MPIDNPKVSIVITTYLEATKPYLDLCIRSIANLNYPKEKLEILLVARPSYHPNYPGVVTLYPEIDDFHNAYGMKFGLRSASKDSKYIYCINDDVMLTSDSLLNAVQAVGDNKMIANSISPCDNYVMYCLHFGFITKGSFVQVKERFYLIEHYADHLDHMMKAQSLYPSGIVFHPFLCMYATLIPRQAFEEIGDWDDGFKTGQDDIDYALRAKQKGYSLVSVLDSLVWHFGGRTADTTMNNDLRKESAQYFVNKYGFLPPGVTKEFLDGK